MTELETAKALQRSILGPNRFMRHCGCVGGISLYYSKMRWAYINVGLSSCVPDFPLAGVHVPEGWYDKRTLDKVPSEQLLATWEKYKDHTGYIRFRRADVAIRIAKDGSWSMRHSSLEGDLSMGVAWDLETVQEAPQQARIQTWPPKMLEVFKKTKKSR